MYCPNCGGSVAAGIAFCPNCGTRMSAAAPPPQMPQMAYAAAPSAYAAAPVFDYATWATRAIGYIIDALLVGLGMGVLYFVLGTVLASMARLGGHDAFSGVCCLLVLLFPLATFIVGIYNSVYLIAQRGFSIGQGVVKVKVVDANGQLLTTGTAFVRLLVRVVLGFVPLLPLLDLLWPLWDSRRQTLHDKAVNCYVINNPSGV